MHGSFYTRGRQRACCAAWIGVGKGRVEQRPNIGRGACVQLAGSNSRSLCVPEALVRGPEGDARGACSWTRRHWPAASSARPVESAGKGVVIAVGLDVGGVGGAACRVGFYAVESIKVYVDREENV